jgi:hypothetical protein
VFKGIGLKPHNKYSRKYVLGINIFSLVFLSKILDKHCMDKSGRNST